MLQRGSMSFSNYEARFHALSRYLLSNIPIEFERIRWFAKGLPSIFRRPHLHWCWLEAVSRVDHARMIEHIRKDK